MKKHLLVSIGILSLCNLINAQNCFDKSKYQQAMRQADSCILAGNYGAAQNFYIAAKIYCENESKAIDEAKDNLFRLINTMKTKSDSLAFAHYANNLAYKSQIVLQGGDHTTAFRLAEFAHRYVDDHNVNVTRAMTDALHYNLFHSPLPWASNFEGHLSTVKSVAFSPDGKLLATGSFDNTAKIWDLNTGKAILTLLGHSNWVNSVAFSPDGKLLVTGSWDGTAKIWNLSSLPASGLTEKCMLTLEVVKTSKNVNSLAFSPDGKKLATGSDDNMAKIWDLSILPSSGKVSQATMTLEGHISSVESVAFSPDGKFLATGSFDNTAKIWDLSTGKTTLTFTGHISDVTCVAYSPNGKLLATGSDNTVKIWNLSTLPLSGQVSKAALSLEGHGTSEGNVFLSLAFSPDGKRLVTGSNDKTAKIWDLMMGLPVLTFKGHTSGVCGVAFSPDGKLLATGGADNIAKTWDLSVVPWSGELRETTLPLKGHIARVLSVAFSPDGKLLASGSADRTTKIWNLSTGKPVLTLNEHKGAVHSVCFSPDGKLLATGSEDNTAKIWDLSTGQIVLTIVSEEALENNRILSVAFSPDGKLLATGSTDQTAKIWNLSALPASGQIEKPILVLEGRAGWVQSVTFSPNGKQLATGNGKAQIWDLTTIPLSGKSEKAILDFSEHTSGVYGVAFSPDGKLLATASKDNTAKIWDLSISPSPGHVRRSAFTFSEGTYNLLSLAFSPDGKQLAVGAETKAVIWDLSSGKAAFVVGVAGEVNSVAFSPDGKHLATGGTRTPKIYELTLQDWMDRGGREKRLAGLTLTQLTTFGLENLLDQKPNNEALLVATGDTWQIAAFADLYADKLAKTLPNKENYERAKRLYQACLASGVEPAHFEKKLVNLEQVWKEKTK